MLDQFTMRFFLITFLFYTFYRIAQSPGVKEKVPFLKQLGSQM